MKKLFVFLLAAMPFAIMPQSIRTPYRAQLQAEWRFRQVGKEQWFPTRVPNSIHSALLENKLIPEPFYGTNEADLQWIERENWEMEGVFDAPEGLAERKHVELIFKGLDTKADVFLNDSLIVEADNMFRSWHVEVKDLIKPKANQLRVVFHNPIESAEVLQKKMGYELPGGIRTLTRKAQFHYGWDWGPRFVGFGIWQPIDFLGWDDFVIDDAWFRTREILDGEAKLTLYYSYRSEIKGQQGIFLRNATDRQRIIEERPMEIGAHSDTVLINLKDPKLWWCRGMGEPNLYDFTLEIRKGATALDKTDHRFGIRKIELVQESDAKGKSFYFKLNGKPVFAKGANYIPQNIFQDRVTPQQYKKLFDDVCESNFNMLRVWGGGIYETDLFYQFADSRGIMIWQDFMYACAMYPGNGHFFKNAASEAIEQVTRLRNHPSIVLFCGNNENNEAWHNWGWQMNFNEQQRKALWNDYKNIFIDLLPTYVDNFCMSTIPYWESSPSFGRADKRSLTEGDSHYWGVWHDEEPFDEFERKVPRFMSEYGFQSFPDWRTIESFTAPEDRKLDSKVMLAHQKHPRGNALIAEYMKRDYRVPKKNFEHFVYVSQLLQAEGMRKAIEAHRGAKPYCMGTLYWQLNDVWPVASWSSRDNFGRWKALQYFVRESFAPVVVLPKIEDDHLRVWASSDLPAEAEGSLSAVAKNFEGKILFSEEMPAVRISADSARQIWQAHLPKILGGQKADNVFVELRLKIGGAEAAKRIVYFTPPKSLKLPFVSIKKEIEQVNDGYLLTLRSDKLAKNVLLKASVDGHFDDNFFDLLPGQTVKVLFRTDQILDDPASRFSVMSLVDTY